MSVTARKITFLDDSMVVTFLSIVVGSAEIVPALSALLVVLLPHVMSIALRPPPLVSRTLFLPLS